MKLNVKKYVQDFIDEADDEDLKYFLEQDFDESVDIEMYYLNDFNTVTKEEAEKVVKKMKEEAKKILEEVS